MAEFKITKGLDLPISGAAEKNLSTLSLGATTGLTTSDYHFKFKLLCKVDDYVKVGSPLVCNKENPGIQLVSTASGRVKEIVRGERRALLAIVIETDGQQEKIEFGPIPTSTGREELIQKLLTSGMWPLIKQRPFDVVADPHATPKSIFVNTMNSGPLTPKCCFIIKGREKAFQRGLDLLTKLTDGPVHMVHGTKCGSKAYTQAENVERHGFSGPHPAGLTSTHINRIDPINMNDTVWTLKAEDVIHLGQFADSGTVPTDKVIAVTGNNAKKRQYYTVNRQVAIQDIITEVAVEDNSRIISGNVLNGVAKNPTQFMGLVDTQITIIPEGGEQYYLGEDKHWTGLGLNSYSTFRLFLSKLMPNKKWNLDTAINGGRRAIILSNHYEKYVPLDIAVTPLIKSIIGNDIDRMEQLGIHEIIPEDVALCTFTCPSKVEVTEILRDGIEYYKVEG